MSNDPFSKYPEASGRSCSPPEELDGTMKFLSKLPDEEEDIYITDEFITDTDIEKSNNTDIEDMEEEVTDTYDDMEETVDNILQDFYPNGTMIKFKCSKTREGKYVSWQIR